MEAEGKLQLSQEHWTCPYSKADESSLCPPILFS